METTVPARQRNRASSACTSCRKSRIRCVVDTGQRKCVQCRNSGNECVFDERDGRKSRGSSKVFADGLCQRIEQLENLLRQQGALNMAQTQTYGDSNTKIQNPVEPVANAQDPASKLPSPPEEPPPYDEQPVQTHRTENLSDKVEIESGFIHGKTFVRKLVPSPVRFDMASGRVRFFGPTTSMNLLSGITLNKKMERQESHWPVPLLIRDLSPETHDCLMDLFWGCHNLVFHIVHKDAFYDDLEQGRTQFYSLFLHFCMLAMGFRYADKGRPDIQRLAMNTGSGHVSSTLHMKAKSLAKLELEKPGGIPSIQAFILLADLECMGGRDDTGWMFAGMSFRLVFDVGLHVDASELQLSEREVQLRHMVLWACIINDRYWSLYLGRPTTFKNSDMAPSCLSQDFRRLVLCKPSGHEKLRETRVYEALLKLMEIVEPLCDFEVKRLTRTGGAYFKIAALDRELNSWYSQLPEDLIWTAENVSQGPASLFLLHSQYHTALILLHRPFVRYSESKILPSSKEPDNERMNHFTMLSRTVCADNAKRITSIFKQYRQRFDLTQVFVTGLQHAGTAATALMAEIVIQSNAIERKELLGNLTCLKETLNLMSRTYQPAVLMCSVVEHFVRDFQKGKETTTTNPSSSSPSLQYLTQEQQMPTPTAPAPAPPLYTTATATATATNTTPSIPPFNLSNPTLTKKRPSASNIQEPPATNSTPSTNKRICLQPSTSAPTSSSIQPPPPPPPPINCAHGNSPKGLPFLPSSWFEGLDLEDTAFLNLMGLKELQSAGAAVAVAATVRDSDSSSTSALGLGLLSSSCFPGDDEVGGFGG